MTIQEVDIAIPELREGFEDLVSFADFCSFLAEDDVLFEARLLIESARALLGATAASLAGRTAPVPAALRG